MGKYKKGILGPFRGVVGTVVGSSWQGQFYMKSLPDVGEDNPTEAQLNVRAKFALVTSFVKKLKSVINVGYQDFTDGITPSNAAVSYHLKNAVTGTSALNYAINYPEVILSVGNLPEVESGAATAATAGQIDLTWLNTVPAGDPSLTDMATILVHCPAIDKRVLLKNAAARTALGFDLPVPPPFSGKEVEVWMFFVSADGKEVSNSAYLGQVTLL